ncbi:MAG: phosphatidylserine/phosphatidylglycerophosphate/cardiolipin synthase family protein [Bdellovibrionota bacterium]
MKPSLVAIVVASSLIAVPLYAQRTDHARAPSSSSSSGYVSNSDDYVHLVKGKHEASILNDGSSALDMRLAMIDRAQKSISIESYIFNADQAGCLVLSALVKKAREMKGKNFQVHLLIDKQILGPVIDPYFVDELANEGIELRYYNTAAVPNVAVNHRNHKKTFTIDAGTPNGEVIVGGRNIADNYFDLAEKNNFSDTDVHVQGPAVDTVQKIFDGFWGSPQVGTIARPDRPQLSPVVPTRNGPDVTARDRSRYMVKQWDASVAKVNACLESTPTKDKLRKSIAVKASAVHHTTTTVDSILVASDGPDWKQKDRGWGSEILKQIDGAKKKVLIENPYIMLIDKPREIVDKKLAQGVKVDVVVNSRLKNDEFSMVTMALYNAKYVAGKKGGGAYLYKGENKKFQVPGVKYSDDALWATHAKTMVVDDKNSYIGSGNFDPRSLDRINSEIGFVFPDNPEFAAQLNATIQNRMKNSTRIDGDGRDPSGVKVETPNYLNVFPFLKIGTLSLFKDQL